MLFSATGIIALIIGLSLSLCTSGAPSMAYTIEGKVEHVEAMPAVERRFTPGIQFDQAVELSPDNVWVKIPDWIAGSWTAHDETAVYRRDFKNGRESNQRQTFKARQDFTYGQQIDKNGQVWHYLGVPYTSRSIRSQAAEIHEVKEKQLVSANDEGITFRAVATVILVDDFNSRIRRTYQQESLTSYHPVGSDRLEMTASTKVFDAGGRPQNLQENEAMIKRSKRFQPVNEKDGKDLRSLFRQFMTARGMAALLVD